MTNRFLKIIIAQLILSFLISFHTMAQDTLWDSVPWGTELININVMYYDSIDDVSYISGDIDGMFVDSGVVVKWDGTNYTLLPPAPLKLIRSIIRYRDKIYVGGIPQHLRSGLSYWDGNSWTEMDTFPNQRVTARDLYVYEDKLYAVGYMHNIGGSNAKFVGVWNDTVWSSLYSIDTVPTWSVHGRAIVNYKGNFYVAGDFLFYDEDSSVVISIIMHDGTRWKGLKSNDSFSVHGSNYWINKLMVWNDTLYIAGMFEERNYHNPGNGIVKWDGEKFHRLSNGLEFYLPGYDFKETSDPVIMDMKVIDNELYVCGGFNSVDGIMFPYDKYGLYNTSYSFCIAKWTGEQWCTIGTILKDGSAYALGNYRDELYLLGGYRAINDDISLRNAAKWVGGSYTDTCATPNLNLNINNPIKETQQSVSIYPNPNKGSFTLSINSFQNKAELNVYDITGRIVHTEAITNREQQITLNGLGKGIYIGRIVGKDGVAVFKVRVE